jgi:hypothetical protein
MFPSESQASRSDVGNVGVRDNLAARCIDKDLAYFSNCHTRISEDYGHAPDLSLSVECRVSGSKAIRQTLPQPARRDSHRILRHHSQRLDPTFLLFHRFRLLAAIVMLLFAKSKIWTGYEPNLFVTT